MTTPSQPQKLGSTPKQVQLYEMHDLAEPAVSRYVLSLPGGDTVPLTDNTKRHLYSSIHSDQRKCLMAAVRCTPDMDGLGDIETSSYPRLARNITNKREHEISKPSSNPPRTLPSVVWPYPPTHQ